MKYDTMHSVKDLINILKTFPEDMPVLVTGYETGYENFYHPFTVKMKHEPENLYTDGAYQITETDDGETFDAVILERVMRYD